ETILKAEGGVASCGGGSYPLAPGGPGPRPPGTTTWLRGARCTDPKATARRCRTAGAEGDGSAAPRPKTATVERREASVPRHGTQGASLGAWPAASRAGPTGVPPSTRTFLGAPPLYRLSQYIH